MRLDERLRKLTACTIEQTVASFDGIVDLISTGIVGDFPEPNRRSVPDCLSRRPMFIPKAHNGHLMAAVELDR